MLCLPYTIPILPVAQKPVLIFKAEKNPNLTTKADWKKAMSGIKAVLTMVIHLYLYREQI